MGPGYVLIHQPLLSPSASLVAFFPPLFLMRWVQTLTVCAVTALPSPTVGLYEDPGVQVHGGVRGPAAAVLSWGH